EDNLKIKVLAGNYKGTVGPLVEEDTEPFIYHFESLGIANVSFETDPDYNIYFFVLEGEVEFAGKKYSMASGAVTESGEQMSFQFSGPAHVIVLGGIPLKEPIAWGGPIVMNTQQELNQAFADLRNGTFIQEEGRHVL
ncbi:MAG: pirin family protein, partial [Tissierellia bacterium]|nr:pirin family protein [Tissierellia bacterium]